MSNKKVLIIGASGSLGEGICNEINNQYDITGTYLNNPKKLRKVKFVKLDITNERDFDKLEQDYDSVILIAGLMPAMMKGYTPKKYLDTNIYGALNVLEFCRKSNIKKLIYIMTFSDRYSHFYSGVPIQPTGSVSLNYTGDHAVYSISKVAACELIEHYYQEYNLQTIIFRIPTVYCYDEKVDYYVDGKIRTKAYIQMIKSVIHKNEIEVWGNKNHAKDMPYIRDFAHLISLAIEHPSAQGVFNAGTGDPIALDTLADTIIEVFSRSKSCKKIYKEDNPSQPNFTFDMKKTKEVFSYEPKYNLKQMLEDIKVNLESKTTLLDSTVTPCF